MPSYDSYNSPTTVPQAVGASSYSKILSIFYKGTNTGSGSSPQGRANRFSIGLKTSEDYRGYLNTIPSGQFQQTAGMDLGGLLMPYQSKIAPSGTLPCFHRDVTTSGVDASGTNPTIYNLLPFRWHPSEEPYIYDRDRIPSGVKMDNINDLISSEVSYGDVNKYRNTANVRGIGWRLPMMGVGWGFDTEGNPFPSGATPSGSDTKTFAGGFTDGYMVDPSDYVAAPFDFRYDKKRHVWTAGSEPGFWAEIVGFIFPSGSQLGFPSGVASGVVPSSSGIFAYKWIERRIGPSGLLIPSSSSPRSGGFDGTDFAFEANNNRNVPSGTKVWMELKGGENSYYAFDRGLTDETTCGRWYLNREDHIWDADNNIWQPGQFYVKNQWIRGYDGGDYVCVTDHSASGTAGPTSPLWNRTTKKGTKFRVTIHGKDSTDCPTDFDAYLYLDSHGHVVRVDKDDDCGDDIIGNSCAGTYQFMIKQRVSQNQLGEDFLMAHSTVA